MGQVDDCSVGLSVGKPGLLMERTRCGHPGKAQKVSACQLFERSVSAPRSR